MNTQVITRDSLPAMGEQFLADLGNRQRVGATVVTLSGNLGAGKTTFVQMLAEKLGVNETVTSPTFVLLKRYDTNHPHFHTLVHIDAYRIEDSSELKLLGIEEIFAEDGVLVCIEWPERVEDILPPQVTQVHLEMKSDTERCLTIV